MRLSLRSRRRWKKHVDVTLAICWHMLSELSSKTTRSRTQSTGLMSTCPRQLLLYFLCVCLCVGHTAEPCKNGWINQIASGGGQARVGPRNRVGLSNRITVSDVPLGECDWTIRGSDVVKIVTNSNEQQELTEVQSSPAERWRKRKTTLRPSRTQRYQETSGTWNGTRWRIDTKKEANDHEPEFRKF